MTLSTPIICYHPPGAPFSQGGGLPLPGTSVYWPSVNMLTQDSYVPIDDPAFSGESVILQEQHISLLPESAIVIVEIWRRGTSRWQRVRDDGSPVTDVDLAGLIVPTEYDPVQSPFVLHRVSGF